MIKLCVGSDSVESLLEWREASSRPGDPWILHTRQTPRRAAELISGGSLYRVYRGVILSRQRILKIETVVRDGAPRCQVTLHDEVVRTIPTPRRAFQGWRYLPHHEAPLDIGAGADGTRLPADLTRRLLELGAW